MKFEYQYTVSPVHRYYINNQSKIKEMIGKRLKDKSKSRGQKGRKKKVRGLTLSEQRFCLFKLKNENALYVEYNCEHTLRCRSWTQQLKVTTQTKAVGQSMVYRQKPDCIIQNGTAGKRGKKGRSGKCLQYRHRYKGDSVCVFIGKFYLMKIGYMFIRILFMLLSYTF